jgi:hypothetical protein
VLDWLKRRVSTPIHVREADVDTAEPHGRAMSGQFLPLFKYLEERYAQTVVLTLGEIEDLLGFSLPDQARLSEDWWTVRAEAHATGPNYSDAWTLARRTATPNLRAHTVVFERLP